ncbi:hypothetical protein ACVWYI_001091 [Bradyrhizobium sp. LB13.1]
MSRPPSETLPECGSRCPVSWLISVVLPAPVRADYGVQLTCRDVERDVVRGNDAAEAAHQLVDAEQRFSHD